MSNKTLPYHIKVVLYVTIVFMFIVESFICRLDDQYEIIYHDQGVLLSPYFGQWHDDADSHCLWTIYAEQNQVGIVENMPNK